MTEMLSFVYGWVQGSAIGFALSMLITYIAIKLFPEAKEPLVHGSVSTVVHYTTGVAVVCLAIASVCVFLQ